MQALLTKLVSWGLANPAAASRVVLGGVVSVGVGVLVLGGGDATGLGAVVTDAEQQSVLDQLKQINNNQNNTNQPSKIGSGEDILPSAERVDVTKRDADGTPLQVTNKTSQVQLPIPLPKCNATLTNGIYTKEDLWNPACIRQCLWDRESEARAKGQSFEINKSAKAEKLWTNMTLSFGGMLPGMGDLAKNLGGTAENRKNILTHKITRLYGEIQYCLPVVEPDSPAKKQSWYLGTMEEELDKEFNWDLYKQEYRCWLGVRDKSRTDATKATCESSSHTDWDKAKRNVERIKLTINKKEAEAANLIEKALESAKQLDEVLTSKKGKLHEESSILQDYFTNMRLDIAQKLRTQMNFEQIKGQWQRGSMTYGTTADKIANIPWGQIMGAIEMAALYRDETKERMKAAKILMESVRDNANTAQATKDALSKDKVDTEKMTDNITTACEAEARMAIGGVNAEGKPDMVLVNQHGEPIDLSGKVLPKDVKPLTVVMAQDGTRSNDINGNPLVLNRQGEVINQTIPYADKQGRLLKDDGSCGLVLGSDGRPVYALAGLAPLLDKEYGDGSDGKVPEGIHRTRQEVQNSIASEVISDRIENLKYGDIGALKQIVQVQPDLSKVVTIDDQAKGKAKIVTTVTNSCSQTTALAEIIGAISDEHLNYFGVVTLKEFQKILHADGEQSDTVTKIQDMIDRKEQEVTQQIELLRNSQIQVAKALDMPIRARISEKTISYSNTQIYGDAKSGSKGLMANVTFSTAGKEKAGTYSLGLINLIPENKRDGFWEKIKDRVVDAFAIDKGIDLESNFNRTTGIASALRPILAEYIEWN
jgi:hypothetical protein